MEIVEIDCSKITGWETFHAVFKKELGFPDFYGANMNAWIDCMTSLDLDDGMSKIKVKNGQVLTLQLKNVKEFAKEHSEIYNSLIECSAFVNWRRIEGGADSILALSFYE